VGHEVLRSLDKSVHVVTIQTLPRKTLAVITARMRVTAAPTSGRTYTMAFLSPTLTTREQPTRVFRASQIPPLEALGQEGRLTNTNDLFGEQIRIHSSVPGRTPGAYPVVMRLYEREGFDRLTRPTTCGYREGGPTPLPVESLPRDSATVRVRSRSELGLCGEQHARASRVATPLKARESQAPRGGRLARPTLHLQAAVSFPVPIPAMPASASQANRANSSPGAVRMGRYGRCSEIGPSDAARDLPSRRSFLSDSGAK
jgi:hypothetical protein